MIFVDLRERIDLVNQYVELRNRYQNFLLTKRVTLEETCNWIKSANVKILICASEGKLLGAAIIYFDKDNEVSIFVDKKSQGIGSKLLHKIVISANEMKLEKIWSWVLTSNIVAQKTFEKNCFIKNKIRTRYHNGKKFEGIEYECTPCMLKI